MGRKKRQPGGMPSKEPTQEELAIRRAFAARLRALRMSLGWTQGEMAERCGLSKVYFGVVELGKKSASLETIARLAKGTGVTPADLLRFDGQPDAVNGESPAERLGRRVAAMAQGHDAKLLARVERVAKVMLEREPAPRKKGRRRG